MAGHEVSFTELDQLAALLAAVEGCRSASVDPGKVKLPGVWIRHDSLGFRLGGATHKLTLHLITPEREQGRALPELAALFNALSAQLHQLGGPSGDLQLVGVVLPGSSTPMPALAVPLDLITD